MTASRRGLIVLALSTVFSAALGNVVRAAEVYIPIVLPITGFLSVEGGSQRNGAIMAIEDAPKGVTIRQEIFDTGTSATGAATALERALSGANAVAVPASVFGTEMVAMAPVAMEYKVPLLTISGLAKLTESGNPYIFRFLPSDRIIKVAQARYAIENLGKKRPALITDNTAYGQGGKGHLEEIFKKLNIPLAYQEEIAVDQQEMTPMLDKVKRSGADVIILHTVSFPMALVVKQARALGIDLPIVTGSSMVAPTATALVEPSDLANVCGETPSAPEAASTPKIKEWADRYRKRFSIEPDGLALGQYDGVAMAIHLIATQGVSTAEAMRDALSKATYEGIGTTYKSDGKGDMAHDADVVCYDGKTRIPKVARHFSPDELVLK
ncbi:MAG TPA: ABC transporter substrate-binding protein [Aestuariivirgaceae bacterium]|nr:ABC transporter substrate-binding protein [Aestuariivirgaceae bacterium]